MKNFERVEVEVEVPSALGGLKKVKKYLALISVFLMNIVSSKGESLGLGNLLQSINGGAKEIRMQEFFYRSLKTASAGGTIKLIDTTVLAADGITNFNNGQLPDKDSIFAVGAISVRYGVNTAANPQLTSYSNSVYKADGSVNIPVGLQNADIEIKCGNVVVLDRQPIRKFFAEQQIGFSELGNYHKDAVELTEMAYLYGGQNISVEITLPKDAVALPPHAHVEISFQGVGTATK